jgi:predicted phosphodiesterase
VICNTGSITFPKNGNIPTFGVLENGVISIYSLEGEKLASETLNIGR